MLAPLDGSIAVFAAEVRVVHVKMCSPDDLVVATAKERCVDRLATTDRGGHRREP